jgi:hypothetical protein
MRARPLHCAANSSFYRGRGDFCQLLVSASTSKVQPGCIWLHLCFILKCKISPGRLVSRVNQTQRFQPVDYCRFGLHMRLK